ncbi:hypothetical protein Drose_04335 [Dactylosporangium roseum]|uniref:MarR family transcriptional regulator n=1 Tax=Dactylosporangium roseum TaxID=47989 RepID=A0ABY5Z9X7_9ACTN|nr:hypothetical protein [Dactylosporangium roseum]UWZ37518.1 hypothetical protein Drose_04335 [Dactylosporangium roseum]
MTRRRITAEQQASEGRVAVVRMRVTRALASTLDDHPDLTHEEILAALLLVADRQVSHMRAGDTP